MYVSTYTYGIRLQHAGGFSALLCFGITYTLLMIVVRILRSPRVKAGMNLEALVPVPYTVRVCTYSTYICMYIHYCTMHAAPHPLEYTDIATYTGLVCLALLLKPQTLFTILVNYAYAC